jgi:CHAT domain-containing protein
MILNPLPNHYPSTARVKSLADILNADLFHGLEYKPPDALHAVQGAKLFHYHGHVEYNPISELDSKMLLYDPKPKEKPLKPVKKEHINARDLFSIKLDSPALATIIGCGSGITSYSSNDELLGFPTALFYAGASSVVSTLWPILDVDGADFATAFYKAIRDQEKKD